ncbi:hypothetical protein [Cellvibrio sp. NN19]|uniref:ORC-CDC6 family AAA ATPase n=1 Tax=Cellvibrio chitinivorans TaxID=3102792 RepID=UPI002B414189|nr:hypothetical protein [Cellvibrio sp. NN19]
MNPFVFNAASNLSNDLLKRIFIPDHNYSRFIESKRNVFFWGERGCGKTMTLLFNRLSMLGKANEELKLGNKVTFLPVYVSCITPLIFKREYLLLDDFKGAVISEHYLSLSVAMAIVDSLLKLDNQEIFLKDESLALDLSYIFSGEFPSDNNPILQLKRFITKKFIDTQKEINRFDSNSFYDDTYSFTSIIVPFIDLLKERKVFNEAHFVLMLDDAHDLNKYQRTIVNSWIAFRDNSSFSFKISAAKSPGYDLSTSSGGAILPGHDYVHVDIEKPFQNDDSAYGQLARKIISKRLELIGIDKTPEDFFPFNSSMIDDMEDAKNEARIIAEKKYGAQNKKSIADFVYKYGRAIYFRNRSHKANRPPYSGFDTIVNISSGVIRNLLEPCFVMYDDMLSKCGELEEVTEISPSVQTDVLLRLSESYWKRLRDGIDNEIGCLAHEGQYVENLFTCLGHLFRGRLLNPNCSEPRAIAFTISAKSKEIMDQLMPILDIARRAQLLYVRSGTAKDRGESEDYYVPNKMLWPSRGLDPVGQHARVSIQARYLLDAAINKTPIPDSLASGENTIQAGLFDE